MPYLAIVKVSGSGRVEKYQEYSTQAEATAHVRRVLVNFPLAYSTLHPGGSFGDWLCDPVEKTAVVDPLPAKLQIPPKTFEEKVTELIAAELAKRGL